MVLTICCIKTVQITEYHYLKVNYESLVTWKLETDHLRCSPNFFGNPRYDSIIYKAEGVIPNGPPTYVFAKFKFIFTIKLGEALIHLAYVIPCDVVKKPSKLDKDLCLYRVRARRTALFIPVDAIVRGALLYSVPIVDAEAPEPTHDEFFVIDTVDADAFLRVKKIFSDIRA